MWRVLSVTLRGGGRGCEDGAEAARGGRGVQVLVEPAVHADGRGRRQGLTLVHFSAQPEPFLTQNTL
jgi:hypothetical protein